MENQQENSSVPNQQPTPGQAGSQQNAGENPQTEQHSQDAGQQPDAQSADKEDVDQAEVDKMRGGWADERVGGGSAEN
ncbi:MAG: hypothetical protein LH606_16485 [Cytophagaceae bacterium]|nr:hypothetical protein [Cytophagaceae bacterium]